MMQIIEGVVGVHNEGLIHRDIKLENILLHSPPGSGRVHVKISDFGFAKILGQSDSNQLKGSRPFLAPELFKDEIKQTQKIDIYALGITFYLMITHRYPLNKPSFQEQRRKISQMTCFCRPSEIKDDLLWDLLSKMLEFDPEKRITAEMALHHPFFSGPQAIADFSPEQINLVQQAKQANSIGDESITEYDMDPYFTVTEFEIKKFILEDIQQFASTQSSSSEVYPSTQSSSSQIYPNKE
ncbi:MAG: putative CAMK/CAMK1 protein kinase [Streblomastix strix]|uniref:Putative CAMK/CAMK1 protein kinase n=1 Tax=Streblomastix strix TaxID=222440 RepID=A0A5J4UA06_9EUKA|nr:MAG: putative CAMK/CAMK1 protein kinase [Streblomastix strix]